MRKQLGNILLTLLLTLLVMASTAGATEKLTVYKTASREQGIFFQLGGAGIGDAALFGNSRIFDDGPALQAGVGYVENRLGVRGSFLYGDLPQTFNWQHHLRLYNSSLEFMFLPLNQTRSKYQPYAFVGPGYYYLKSKDPRVSQNGFGGNTGVGINIHLSKRLSVGTEGSFRPVIFGNNVQNSNDLYLYSFGGFLRVYF